MIDPITGIALVIVAIVLTGCADDDDNETIKPLDPPPDDLITPPTDGGRNTFTNVCAPPEQSLQLLIDGRNIKTETGDTVEDACFSMQIDRQDLCFAGEDCDPQGLLGSGEGNEINFIGRGRFGPSSPLELQANVPGDPGFELAAQMSFMRAQGQSLSNLVKVNESNMSVNWGEVFPDFATNVGYVWPFMGVFHRDTCDLEIISMQSQAFKKTEVSNEPAPMDAVSDAGTADEIFSQIFGESSKFTAPADVVALPFYAPRRDGFDCVAEARYSNEFLNIHEGAMAMTLPLNETTTVCGGDSDISCPDGASEIVATLVVEDVADGGIALEPVAEEDMPDAGVPDSGMGIPPLAPPDAGGGN